MIQSVASGNSKAVENYSASDVLPDFFESESKKLIVLIKEYYKHLNTELGPSFEISNLISSHDIDLASEKYLDAIERVIAPNIPQSETLDRQRLFKIIANYYTNRGSEESVYTFFKIFYNEVVTLIYPKDFIFDTSNDKSVSSDKFKLRDSYRYQEFSYLISSNRDAAEWKSEFKKFVHPAGLKFFTALTISAIGGDTALETMWNDGCGVLTKYLKDGELPEDPCDFWESIDWEKAVGKHSPLFQPCIDLRLVYVFTVLYNSNVHYIEYLRNTINSKCSKYNLKAIYASYAISLLITDEPYGQVKRWDDIYRGIGKYLEHGAYTDGYSDYTIGGTELEFNPGRTVENNNTRFAGWSYDTSVDDFSRSYTCIIDPNETPIVDLNAWADYTNEVIDAGDRKKITIGNSIDTSLSVIHNFNTYDIVPLLKNNITGELSVYAHTEVTDLNTVVFNFDSAPNISEYSAYIFKVDITEFTNGYVESFEGSDTIETDINGTSYWIKDISHNLSHDKLLFSVRDLETNEFVLPNATYINNDILRLTFAEEPAASPGGYYVTIYYNEESNDFSSRIGNGIDTEIIVDHGIGYADVAFALKEISTGDAVQFVYAEVIDDNNIKLEFNTPPSSEQYEIYIKQASSSGILENFLSFKLGDGLNSVLPITHNLGTTNVIPIIHNVITGELNDIVQWEVFNENIISFIFSEVPQENEYYVTIFKAINNNQPVNNGFTEIFDGDDTIISGNDYVLIEDINNPADGSYGSVSYDYEIAKYEIKISDIELWWDAPLPISGDPDSSPLGFSFNQFSRFINWLNVRYGYHEAYNFTTSNDNDPIELWPLADSWSASNRFRHKDARYFIPSEDEWYKAAYYDPNKNGEGLGGYYEYPTGSDTPPTAVASGTDEGTAVFDQDPINDTVASVYEAGGLSSYGTMGQGGNAYEFIEDAANSTIDLLEELTFVTIGDEGNAVDITTGFGDVSYAYDISKFEITEGNIAEYNADPANNLQPITLTSPLRGANKPATDITWNECARYVNWLNEREGIQPAYNFTAPGSSTNIEVWTSGEAWQTDGENLFRHKDAKYFIPNENEWYKAAYYKSGGTNAGYWLYPTGSDSAPTAVTSGTVDDTAVFVGAGVTPLSPADVTEAGGLSPYGTMGQGGNVYEHTENTFDGANDNVLANRVYRGGSFGLFASNLTNPEREFAGANIGSPSKGLRVAKVNPEANRVIRGGSWGYDVSNLSKSTRFQQAPQLFGTNSTLRLARNPSAIKINSGTAIEPADNSIWTYNVNHNLNNENVIFAVSELIAKQNIMVSGRTVDSNNLELSFNEKPELSPDSLKVSVFYDAEPSDRIFNIGDGINNEIEINHNIGSSNIMYTAREISTGDLIYVQGKAIDNNTLKLFFDEIPSTAQYQIYIKNIEYIKDIVEYGSALDDLNANDVFISDSDYLNSLVYFEPGPASELICWYATESNSN